MTISANFRVAEGHFPVTVCHSLDDAGHSLGTACHFLATACQSLATAGKTLGTVGNSLGTACQSPSTSVTNGSTISINTIAECEVLRKIETSVIIELYEKVNIAGFLTNAESWNLLKGEKDELERTEIEA